MNQRISKSQARWFLLEKQLLNPPQSLSGLKGVETVFNSLRVIQYDPLNPCGRNPDLVLQSRVSEYHCNDYHYWLYNEKKGIEVYDKELCIIPIEDFPFTAYRHSSALKSKDRSSFLKKYQQELNELLSKIENNGPISSSDIKSELKVMSGWGTNALFGRIALEALWKTGKLAIVKREGMKKYYDLIHRIYSPTTRPQPKLTTDHIIRRLNSVGMLPKITSGGGWQGLGGGTTQLINKLIKDKTIIEIKIQNSRLSYLVLKKDLDILLGDLYTNKTDLKPKMVFIAPLDNLIWDRVMTEDLFHFRYRWEVYTPKAKREFGYYTLPILFGDQFIGRIEPVKQADRLLIKGIWEEFPWDKEMQKEFKLAIQRFCDYLRISKFEMELG